MSWIDGVTAMARGLLRRSVEEDELDEEIRFHLRMETEKLVRTGLDPTEARRMALVRFGGVDRMKEQTRDERGVRWIEDLAIDAGRAARGLRTSPDFTIPVVLTLALGIAATTAAFSLVDGVLLRPLPFAEPQNLIELRELGDGRIFYPSYPNFRDWRARARTLDGMLAIQTFGEQPILDAGAPAVLQVVGISRDFLSVLGLSPELGRDFTVDENTPGGPDVAMVSHHFWQTRLGGNPDLTVLSFHAYGASYRVVGVLPPRFGFLYDADVYLPLERWPGTVRSSHAHRVVARLAPAVSLADAKRELDAIAGQINREHPGASQAETVQVRPLSDRMLGHQQRPLWMLLAASGLVLLVACSNIASTLLARGTARAREFAVRSSLGAGRGRLVRQVLTESALLAAIGSVLGIALAAVVVEWASSTGPAALPRIGEVGVDHRSLLVALATGAVAVLLFGLYPALRAGRTSISGTVATAGRRGTSARLGPVWKVLLGVEAGTVVVLLAGAGLLVRSLLTILTQDAGWDAESSIEMAVTIPAGVLGSADEAVALIQGLERDIRTLPGVEAVGVGTLTPMDAGTMVAPAREADTEVRSDNYTGWRLVDSQYFAALGMRLSKGRLLEDSDVHAAVINESLARILWSDEDPIGRRVLNNYHGDQTAVVVGVVEDARHWRWEEGTQPEMYVPVWSHVEHVRRPVKLLIRASSDPGPIVAAARTMLLDRNGRVPVEFKLLRDALDDTVGDRRFVTWVLVGFGATALLLALVGIYGVVSYSVAQRRREIGVRIALGARGRQVKNTIRVEVLRSVGLGIVGGALTSLALAGVVESLLYETPARDPGTLIGIVTLLLLTAVAASEVPARRAAGVAPSEVLRE